MVKKEEEEPAKEGDKAICGTLCVCQVSTNVGVRYCPKMLYKIKIQVNNFHSQIFKFKIRILLIFYEKMSD